MTENRNESSRNQSRTSKFLFVTKVILGLIFKLDTFNSFIFNSLITKPIKRKEKLSSWSLVVGFGLQKPVFLSLLKNSEKVSRNNPRPIFSNCMQNDITSMRRCLTSFHKKTVYYCIEGSFLGIFQDLTTKVFLKKVLN